MTEDETRLSENAFVWVKGHANELIRKFGKSAEVVADRNPTTIFMAGSPGAGKTEVSKGLALQFEQKPIRIDAD